VPNQLQEVNTDWLAGPDAYSGLVILPQRPGKSASR